MTTRLKSETFTEWALRFLDEYYKAFPSRRPAGSAKEVDEGKAATEKSAATLHAISL
jgi:hypothetical protein